MLKHSVTKALLALGLLALAARAHAADIKVMGDSPLGPALIKVADLFRQEMHTQVDLVLAPSPVVKKKIDDGEAADVVIVQPDFIEELTKAGKVNAGNRPVVGRVGIGLGVRVDSPARDISTPEKLTQILLQADTLVFNNVASGNHFASVLERLGIAETLKPKIVRTSPNGIFEPVLKGKSDDIAVGTIPLIATTPGIKVLGPLPGDLQHYLVYTAVPLARTQQREPTESFINFLTSAKAKDVFAANGVD